jgi:hypothetical protein
MANRLATVRWGETRKQIEDAVAEFETRAFQELPSVEKIALELYQADEASDSTRCRQYLTKYTNDFARAAMDKWWELGDTFWATFARGF